MAKATLHSIESGSYPTNINKDAREQIDDTLIDHDISELVSLPNNSKTTSRKEAREPIQQIVQTTLAPEKTVNKISKLFFGDSLKNVSKYVVVSVLLPSIKDIIYDVITGGTDKLLYGDSGRNVRRNGNTSYNKVYDGRPTRRNQQPSNQQNVNDDFNRLSFNTRWEAEKVLEKLQEQIDAYDNCTVKDLLILCGRSSDVTDQYYGWTNIDNADIVRSRDGRYTIVMPKTKVIK